MYKQKTLSVDKNNINFQDYRESVCYGIENNNNKLRKMSRGEIFDSEIYRFSLNGGLVVNDLNKLGLAGEFLARREGRYSKKCSRNVFQYNTRGPRYITAIDPSIEFMEKLAIYRDDVFDAFQFLDPSYIDLLNNQVYEISPILDYLKNALITIFNSFTQSEKTGELRESGHYYWKLRQKLQNVSCKVVGLFYKSLQQSLNIKDIYSLTYHDLNIVTKVINALEKEYKKYSLSSRTLVRPESSHPRRILATAELVVLYGEHTPNIVVGMPSGGTELACLIYQKLYDAQEVDVDLYLIPISLHSLKNDYDVYVDETEIASSLLDKIVNIQSTDNVIIADDNSSTGQTIELVRNSIHRMYGVTNFEYAIAEADLIRTEIDFKSNNRPLIANLDVYKFSSGV